MRSKQLPLMIISSILFFVVRIVGITSFPMLNDEAIYLHWGTTFYETINTSSHPLISIDGKQPGVPIVYGLVQMLPFDPLTSGRLMNIVCAFITYIFTLLVAKKLFPQQTHFMLSLFLIFCPYLVFYDRTALPDGMVTMFYSISLYVLISLLQIPSLLKSLLLGTGIGVGWWFKSTMLLAIPSVMLFFLIQIYTAKHQRRQLLICLGSCLLCTLAWILPLMFHPWYRDSQFPDVRRLLSLQDLVHIPYLLWFIKIRTITTWLINYVTLPILFMYLFALIYRHKNQEIRILALWTMIPLIVEIFLLKEIFFSRWILMVMPVVLLLAEQGMILLGRRKWVYASLSLAILVILSGVLILNPRLYYQCCIVINKSQDDIALSYTGWSSGYGVKEAADWIITHTEGRQTVVFVRDDSGNPEDGIYVYLRTYPNIRVIPDINIQALQKNREYYEEYIKQTKFFYVSRGQQFNHHEQLLEEQIRFKKPFDQEFIGIYQVDI